MLEGASPRTMDVTFPGGAGRWEVRRGAFRQDGRPHTLLVLADVSKALREEQLQAWQRLVRVLSHEINNSLAPIKSIAGSLLALVDSPHPPSDADADLRRGLNVISGRSRRWCGSCRRTLDWQSCLRRTKRRSTSRVGATGCRARDAAPGRRRRRPADDAARRRRSTRPAAHQPASQRGGRVVETHGNVEVRWTSQNGALSLIVEDEGPGLANAANLFVPFFTTEAAGSGIGLVLSRQIAEAHGGTLTLQNRGDRRGCSQQSASISTATT
jgi:signal transduction histidine kinase